MQIGRMDTGLATKPRLEASDARFSMRGMLGATLVVALFAAVAGPLVRSSDRDEQIQLLTVWGICAVAVLSWIGIHAYRRFRAEALLGETLLRLPVYGPKGEYKTRTHRNVNVAVGLILGCLFLTMATMSALYSPGPRTFTNVLVKFGFIGFFGVWLICLSITIMWSGVRFGEHGVLLNRRLLRWTHILECRWLDSDPGVLEIWGIDHHNRDLTAKIPITKEQQLAVRAILEQKLPGPLLRPGAASHLAFGQQPISTIARTKHLRRHLVFGFLGGAVGLALLYWGFGHRTGVPEFDRSIFWGLIGFLLSKRFVHRPGRQAGAPLVRVFARRDLAGFATTVLVAIALYAIGWQWGWTSVLLAYAAGLGFGLAIASVIAYFARTQLDLAENGIVVRGAFYWPWQTVRVVDWNASPQGRLVLGRGWRRVVAIVPPEQCEAVENVLTEKLPVRQGAKSAAEDVGAAI